MAVTIGGRIEAVAPRRSLFGPDYLRLAALAAVSVAVHLWLVGHTAVTARDGLGFARYALALQSPHAASVPHDPARTAVDVVRHEKHPPGYPAAVWLTAKFVRKAAAEMPLSESTLLAAQIVSAAAAVLLVLPTYLLGRMLFGRNVAFAAALLFQVLPVPARITSDGLSEGLYLLAVAGALVLGVRAVRRPGVGGFLVCGLATGLGYLVRPEGLMVAGAVGLVAAWLGLTRKWPRDAALGRLTALAVGVALVAAPYMLMIGNFTNKTTPKGVFDTIVSPRQKMMEGSTRAPGGGGAVFAAYWHIPPGAGPVGVVWPAVVGIVEETGKGLHYAAAGLALFGLVALRRRLAAEPGLCVLVALAGLNIMVLVSLGVTGYYVNGKHTGYVSERHTVLLVLVGCLFAAAALEPLAALLASVPKLGRVWAGRLAPVGLLLAVVAAALPSTLKPMHPHREGFKHAGRWLRQQHEDWLRENEGRPTERREPAARVIDPFEWSDWYSERTLYCIPDDPAGDAHVVSYAVIDNTKTREGDHERLPRLDAAKAVKVDGRAERAYHWPPDVPWDEAKVQVYRLDGRKK